MKEKAPEVFAQLCRTNHAARREEGRERTEARRATESRQQSKLPTPSERPSVTFCAPHDLQPCPFCDSHDVKPIGKSAAHVWCDRCDTHGPIDADESVARSKLEQENQEVDPCSVWGPVWER